MAARHAHTTPRKRILVLIWSSSQSVRDFLAGFARYARQRKNWDVYLRHSQDYPRSRVQQEVADGRFDAVVTSLDQLEPFPELADHERMHVILFSTYQPVTTRANVVFVQNDNAAIGRMGASYLASLGQFRSYGFVTKNIPTEWSDTRAKNFAAALAHTQKKRLVYRNGETPGTLDAWLAALPKPAAVMAACDARAIEVLEACKRQNLAVPRMVSVLGVDNDDLLCEFDTPTLSSLLPRHDTAGMLAGKTLARLFRGWRPKEPKRVLCDEQDVIERESTAAITPATHLSLSALDFIRKNATRNIRVSDVVAYLRVSRSLADLRFREFQGESIRQAIQRIRFDVLRKKLLSTRMPITKLARVCGYTNVSHLETMFRRQFGMSLARYRQAHQTVT